MCFCCYSFGWCKNSLLTSQLLSIVGFSVIVVILFFNDLGLGLDVNERIKLGVLLLVHVALQLFGFIAVIRRHLVSITIFGSLLALITLIEFIISLNAKSLSGSIGQIANTIVFYYMLKSKKETPKETPVNQVV